MYVLMAMQQICNHREVAHGVAGDTLLTTQEAVLHGPKVHHTGVGQVFTAPVPATQGFVHVPKFDTQPSPHHTFVDVPLVVQPILEEIGQASLTVPPIQEATVQMAQRDMAHVPTALQVHSHAEFEQVFKSRVPETQVFVHVPEVVPHSHTHHAPVYVPLVQQMETDDAPCTYDTGGYCSRPYGHAADLQSPRG